MWRVQDTFWLTATNIALGVLVAVCILAVAGGLLCEILSGPMKRRSYRTELKRDMREMFGPPRAPGPGRTAILATIRRWASFPRGR